MRKIPIRPTQLQGWRPWEHVGLSESPKIAAGKNYRWTMNHVCSGWGNDFAGNPLPVQGKLEQFVATFNVTNRAYLFTPYGVFYQPTEKSEWELALAVTPTLHALDPATPYEDLDYPWSHAFVGDTHYFAHPAVGIVTYQWPTAKWQHHGDSLGTFECPITGPIYSITAASNRLIIQSRDTISWSRPDDGLELSCGTICSGNFISSSVAEYGKPLGLASFGRNAIAWTTSGAILLTAFAPNATQADWIAEMGFTANPLNAPTLPINPYAFDAFMSGQVILLAKNGLHITNGAETQPFEQEFSEYFTQRELNRRALLHNQHAVRVTYSTETSELFISTIHWNPRFQKLNVYARASVFNTVIGKWSSFDQEHIHIGPVNFGADNYLDYMLGFLGSDRRPHWLNYAYHNSYNDVLIPLDSEIYFGPLTLTDNEQLYFIETVLSRLRLYAEARSVLFNFDETSYHSPLETDASMAAILGTYSDFDASSYLKDRAKTSPAYPETHNRQPFPASAKIQNYGCDGAGLYHIIYLATEQNSLDQFYSIAGFAAELTTINTIG